MTGSTRSSDGLDARRRRLLFRSWHRGTREADLIMGRFADAHIEGFSDAELDQYEHLLEALETDLLAWVTGVAAVPAEHDTAMFRRVRDFHFKAGRVMAKSPAELLAPDRPLTLASVADGAEGLVIGDLARAVAARKDAPATSALVICRDGPRMAALARSLAFFAPDIEVLQFPAWDCLPYDRVSPHAGVVAQRMTALSRLARIKGRDKPAVLLTTVNAVLQRVPARELVGKQALSAAPGNVLGMEGVIRWLELNGFNRASTVREPGDYAVRGGIFDLFAAGMDLPVRLDFFGDTLGDDPELRSRHPAHRDGDARARSCAGRRVSAHHRHHPKIPHRLCGGVRRSRSRRHALRGGERGPPPSRHGALAAAVPRPSRDAVRLCAGRAGGARESRRGRRPRAVGPDQGLLRGARRMRRPARAARSTSRCRRTGFILPEGEWAERLKTAALARLTPFAVPEQGGAVIDVGARAGHNFSAERAENAAGVFDAVSRHVQGLQAGGKRVAVALWSEGARERMKHVLAEHGLHNLTAVGSWAEALALPKPEVALAVLGLESGFETSEAAVVSEQDILGDRLVRPRRAAKRAENFIAEVTSLSTGDLVVHVDHGIGRFVGLAEHRGGGRAARLPGNPLCRRGPSSISPSRTSSCCRVTARRTPASSSIALAAPAGRRARRG